MNTPANGTKLNRPTLVALTQKGAIVIAPFLSRVGGPLRAYSRRSCISVTAIFVSCNTAVAAHIAALAPMQPANSVPTMRGVW